MSDFDLLPEALKDGVPDCPSDDFCGVREDDDDDCPEDHCLELELEFEGNGEGELVLGIEVDGDEPPLWRVQSCQK